MRYHGDLAMRWVVGGCAVAKQAASTSQMGRFETEFLAADENLSRAGRSVRQGLLFQIGSLRSRK